MLQKTSVPLTLQNSKFKIAQNKEITTNARGPRPPLPPSLCHLCSNSSQKPPGKDAIADMLVFSRLWYWEGTTRTSLLDTKIDNPTCLLLGPAFSGPHVPFPDLRQIPSIILSNCQYHQHMAGIYQFGYFKLILAFFFFNFEGWFRGLFQMYDLNGVYHEKADVRGIPKMW